MSVEITPEDVVVEKRANKTSHYGMDLKSTGESIDLDLVRLDESGDLDLQISETYLGEENITLKVDMNEWVPPKEQPRNWLECCDAGEAGKALDGTLTRSMDLFISDP